MPGSPSLPPISTSPELQSIQLPSLLRHRLSQEEIGKLKNKKMRRFYHEQNEDIDALEAMNSQLARYSPITPQPQSAATEDIIIPTEEDDGESYAARSGWTIQAPITFSFLANVCLFAMKIIIFIASGSLTVLAATIDSALDLFSGSILFITNRIMKKVDIHLYPTGKTRYENLGIIVFASVMGTASLQVIISSIQRIAEGIRDPQSVEVHVDLMVMLILGVVIVTKFLLFLWCRRIGRKSASCAALAQDHLNDTFTNSLTLIFVGIVKATDAWWVDPAGAILFSIYIIFNWARTGHYHLTLLAGRTASKRLINQFTYFAAYFHPLIQKVDTVRVYHSGIKVVVEVDIILPEDMTLRRAHDIGEALQKGLEGFDEVLRAYVHVDWECDHHASHEHKLV